MKTSSKSPTLQAIKSNTKKAPIAERLMHFAQAQEDAGRVKRYEAVLGHDRPVDVPLASFSALMREGAAIARSNLSASLAPDDGHLKYQVNRVAICSIEKVAFSVAEARKIATQYGRAGYDGFATVRFSPVPDPDTGAEMMAVDVVVLFCGTPEPKKISRRRRPAVDGVERSVIETIALSDRAAVKAAIAAMFYPPLTRTPSGDPLDAEGVKFRKGSNQLERALVTLMCRSQLPAKKMLVGFGAGKAIVDAAYSRIDYLLKEKCKGMPEFLHRDLVAHFWFDELRSLELHHLSVPKITLS
jgi:hypothetical protein